MFTAKKTQLFAIPGKKATTTSGNSFVNKGMEKSAVTVSGNGGKKFSTTGNDFVDQFGKITNYRQPRSYKDVDTDMRLLWSQNKLMTLALVFYIRMITRVVTLFDGRRTSTSQRGQGLKHEGIFRMIWLHVNASDTFWKNITLFVSVGSWKDIFTMLSYDLQWNGWDGRVLDWSKFGQLILAGLENPNTSELVKKYLPTIKPRSRCTTIESQANNLIGKWLANALYGKKAEGSQSYKQYRQLKSSGTAHQWQQVISRGKFLDIDFGTVHGRALAQLVSSKFLENKGLTGKYEQWIEAQPIAKYTGFAYELLSKSSTNMKPFHKMTMNKQFEGLTETARNGMNTDSTFMVALDTSGSMRNGNVGGTGMDAYNIGKAMAVYFGQLLTGPFKGHLIEFSGVSQMVALKGDNPVDQYLNFNSNKCCSTDFLSIGRLFADLKRKGVPESEFPTGLLCISDGEFNSAGSNRTNSEAILNILRTAGFSKDFVSNFKFVFWDIPNNYYNTQVSTKFETYGNVKNVFYMSGLDGAGIGFLTGTTRQEGTPQTAEELFQAAMDQECLNMLEV